MNDRCRSGAKSGEVAVRIDNSTTGCTSQTPRISAARRSRMASITSPASAAAASASHTITYEEPVQASPIRRQNSDDPRSTTAPP